MMNGSVRPVRDRNDFLYYRSLPSLRRFLVHRNKKMVGPVGPPRQHGCYLARLIFIASGIDVADVLRSHKKGNQLSSKKMVVRRDRTAHGNIGDLGGEFSFLDLIQGYIDRIFASSIK